MMKSSSVTVFVLDVAERVSGDVQQVFVLPALSCAASAMP
jgi:hypothetical protein